MSESKQTPKKKQSIWSAITILYPEYFIVLCIIAAIVLYLINLFYVYPLVNTVLPFNSSDMEMYVTEIPVMLMAEVALFAFLVCSIKIVKHVFTDTTIPYWKTIRAKAKILKNITVLPLTEDEFTALHFETVEDFAAYLNTMIGYMDYTIGCSQLADLPYPTKEMLYELQYAKFQKAMYWWNSEATLYCISDKPPSQVSEHFCDTSHTCRDELEPIANLIADIKNTRSETV